MTLIKQENIQYLAFMAAWLCAENDLSVPFSVVLILTTTIAAAYLIEKKK